VRTAHKNDQVLANPLLFALLLLLRQAGVRSRGLKQAFSVVQNPPAAIRPGGFLFCVHSPLDGGFPQEETPKCRSAST